jgi:hypothetical protein
MADALLNSNHVVWLGRGLPCGDKADMWLKKKEVI